MSLSRSIANSYITLCEEGNDPKVVANSVATFLKENNLISLQKNILDNVEMIEKEKENYNSLNIRSAFPLTAHTTKEIAEGLCGENKVKHRVEEDKKLIAGFVARYRGVEWDASMQGVVSRLRQLLKEQ
ncbi:F0F1 ATP synthase subunit delta [Candidatus Nomurabacteria bacterium]|nr:F0F1 ATP synthase subunit delta [Candidatus Nomurabacteria bacterium]